MGLKSLFKSKKSTASPSTTTTAAPDSTTTPPAATPNSESIPTSSTQTTQTPHTATTKSRYPYGSTYHTLTSIQNQAYGKEINGRPIKYELTEEQKVGMTPEAIKRVEKWHRQQKRVNLFNRMMS